MTGSGIASVIISGLLGGVSAVTHELRTSDALLRSPLALSRRIGIVQAVNASAGEATLLWHAGLTRSAGNSASADHRRMHPSTAADARAGLPTAGTGLIALDLALDQLGVSAG